MRRFAFFLTALMLTATAHAQDGSYCGYCPPSGATGLSSNGTVLTSTLPLLLPNGTAAAPSLAFATDATLGLYKSAANTMYCNCGK